MLAAAFAFGAGCGTSSMMRAEQGTASGRAAARSSSAVSRAEQERLQASAVESASAGIGAERGESDEKDSSPGSTWFLECGDEGPSFVVRIEGDSARLYLREGEVVLKQVPSPSGTRYTDGKTVLWTRGDAAVFEAEDGSRFACSNDPHFATNQTTSGGGAPSHQ